MDRTVTVAGLDEVARAMEQYPEYMRTTAPKLLYQTVNIRPMNQIKTRTPLATNRRYKYYVRSDGKKTEVNRIAAGSTGMLRRSIGSQIKGMTVRVGTIRGDVIYAHRLHETKNPGEGQYWAQGMRGFGRGWTTKKTGNKFIEKPVRDSAAYVPKKLCELIEQDLEGMNL